MFVEKRKAKLLDQMAVAIEVKLRGGG